MEEIDKAVLEEKFAALPAIFKTIEDEIREIEEQERILLSRKSNCKFEMFRLQGEHRLLKDLLEPKE